MANNWTRKALFISQVLSHPFGIWWNDSNCSFCLLVLVRGDDEHDQLLSKVKKLELELSQMKSELLTDESMKTSCEKIDVIQEKVSSVTVPVKKPVILPDFDN